MMVVMGWDPSPSGGAWAMLRIDSPSSRVWIDYDEANDDVEIGAALRRMPFETIIAIEQPAGYAYSIARSKGLHETARMGGIIEATAKFYGHRVERVSAAEWRKALIGKPNASNAQVKTMVGMLTREMPRTNNHVRDAAGCALAVAMKLGGGRKVA